MTSTRLRGCCVLLALAIAVPVLAGTAEDTVLRFETQRVEVADFPAAGPVLAIGGGGEGIIGRLKGGQVVAIDISSRELEEAPPGPLKIVMDARDMGFVDGSFATATSFFTLMYINGSDHPQVFEEVHRVLAPGGRFLVWDVDFGPRPEGVDVGVVMLEVGLPDMDVSTGYGSRWPATTHDLDYYRRLAEDAGFKVAATTQDGRCFYLELTRP